MACGIISCSSYRHMQKINASDDCLQKFKPRIQRALYSISVDVTGNQISGLLLIKTMPDSSTRMVFSNEMGFSFFDFGFSRENEFKVYQIIPQMDKKAVIKTLRKDFELMLFRNMPEKRRFTLQDSSLIYYGFPQTKGVNYYITDTNCSKLVKMQRASKRKAVMEAFMYLNQASVPDSVLIRHLNFQFSITLKKI
ncbi:MAG: hypothetical protein Q8939_19325 [Bacteroidota bacterium]|nr:hypothetical protein [Bacteroidota bacterium]